MSVSKIRIHLLFSWGVKPKCGRVTGIAADLYEGFRIPPTVKYGNRTFTITRPIHAQAQHTWCLHPRFHGKEYDNIGFHVKKRILVSRIM